MIENTDNSCGGNFFNDFTFSSHEWSAPTMFSPEEIKALLYSFKLEGRKIKRLRMIGLAYNLTRDRIEEQAYDCLNDLDEEQKQKKSEYSYIAPETIYSRYAEIDEPFLIEFDDGDTFEIDTHRQHEFRMSMNCIPWEIEAGINLPNAEADLLFSPCIGKLIKTVEIKTYTTDENPMYQTPFDEQKSKQTLVSEIIIWFEDGLGLSFTGLREYCHVALLDKDGNVDQISFENLKHVLFNPEDLHTDIITGFEAESNTFNFGDLGAAHTDPPYITLVPSGTKSKLTISNEDFLLLDWSITIYMDAIFDEYGEYEFTYKQWKDVLKIAKKIISFTTFDDLFEYIRSFNITGRRIIGGSKYNVMLSYINRFGAEFWNHLNQYKTQLNDMLSWTSVAFSKAETIKIYGF